MENIQSESLHLPAEKRTVTGHQIFIPPMNPLNADFDGIEDLIFIPTSGPLPNVQWEELNAKFEQLNRTVNTFFAQLYGIPIEQPNYLLVNGLQANFIFYDDAIQFINRNKIERVILDPGLQPWAGPPGSPNRIVTLFGKNGITYLVRAQYKDGQILQPN